MHSQQSSPHVIVGHRCHFPVLHFPLISVLYVIFSSYIFHLPILIFFYGLSFSDPSFSGDPLDSCRSHCNLYKYVTCISHASYQYFRLASVTHHISTSGLHQSRIVKYLHQSRIVSVLQACISHTSYQYFMLLHCRRHDNGV